MQWYGEKSKETNRVSLQSWHNSVEHFRQHRNHLKYGDAWGVTLCLLDGPESFHEIKEEFLGVGRRFGVFAPPFGDRRAHSDDLTQELADQLRTMTECGWVVFQNERYALTPLGRVEADRAITESQLAVNRLHELVRPAIQPETAAKVAVIVEIILTVIKLPAALLSGSVGLLNDSADTLLDLFSSLFVYLGLRFDKERVVNVVLVLLMLGTGSYTLFEAVNRFFVPFTPEVDWFPFVAAVLSAIVSAGLWAYQRFVGLRSGNMALITQSIDSHNHVIVAISVTAGLVASILHFGLLDTLVGLSVAILILKSAVELGIELVRSMGQETVDLSHYHFWFADKYDQFRQTQLRDWMLHLVKNQTVQTRGELIARAHAALDFSSNRILQSMGLGQASQGDDMIEQSLAELFERGWVSGEQQLGLTDAGQEYLSRKKYRVGHRRVRRVSGFAKGREKAQPSTEYLTRPLARNVRELEIAANH